MVKNLIERVLKTTRNYEMLQPKDRVLAAVSGGPDSIFLLHALIALKGNLKLGDLSVCNLDHGLRGAESKADSLFVKGVAERFKMTFIHKRVDLKRIKSKKLSVEEVAREERYKFFNAAAKKVNANIIATGHTLDDQAETILMRLIKGASLKGMVGISPVREESGLKIIRPLLELEKEEIKEYLDEKHIEYRIDRTNLESVYFRNVVRSDIIPFLERYNPRLKRVLSNLAEHLREDFKFIEEERSRAKRHISCQEGRVELSLKDIVIQPKAIQKEILRDALEMAGGELKRLSFRHWKEMEHLIGHKRKGNSIDLPGGIRITRTDKALAFSQL
ncbi:MAG: tRNA lysidine(34) synthetase TilS [Candidatus Omnitrophica bacterium]|nr:tRNA lysidine(34) synthetase TilS [Candidatus Omnitrophota bacterium]